jgi:hypothetical protein
LVALPAEPALPAFGGFGGQCGFGDGAGYALQDLRASMRYRPALPAFGGFGGQVTFAKPFAFSPKATVPCVGLWPFAAKGGEAGK